MNKKYFIVENTAWFCISLYYSRKEWGKLMQEIRSFCKSKESLFSHKIIYLSEYYGENIQLVFSLPANNNDLELIQEETDSHFRSYILNNPSGETKPCHYGKTIWCNYTNNSIEWNIFEFSHMTKSRYLNFLHATSSLMIDLFEDDYSINNTISIVIFLSVKMLKIYSVISDNQSVGNIINKVANNLLYKSRDNDYNLKEELELRGVSFEEMMGLIEQYWNYEVEDNPLFNQWEDEIRKITTLYPDYFSTLFHFIRMHLDINDYMALLIVYSLKNWRQTKHNQES